MGHFKIKKAINQHMRRDNTRIYICNLFKEVWKLDENGYYQNMVDSDFIKVVSKKWLEDHNFYYGCRILNDDEYDTDDITDYTRETQNML